MMKLKVAGWERIAGFSFMQVQPDGFYRLHKIMRDVLCTCMEIMSSQDVHRWFCNHWKDKHEIALSWYHRWVLEPEESLNEWAPMHVDAIKTMQIARARELLGWWEETPLDEYDRRLVGDMTWAETHFHIANALGETPLLGKGSALSSAIDHYLSSLRVYTESDFPYKWATTQNNLGNAYANLPTGDRGENLNRAIEYYEAALRVYTEPDFPYEWATTQNNLGTAYADLPTGDRGENLNRALSAFKLSERGYHDVGMEGKAMSVKEKIVEVLDMLAE